MKHILPCGDHLRIVDSNTIYYIGACQNYTKIYLSDDSMLLCSMSMVKLLELLGTNFLLVHKSYAVNIRAVEIYKKSGSVALFNSVEIPVSRRRQKDIVEQWREFAMRGMEANIDHLSSIPADGQSSLIKENGHHNFKI